MLSAAFVVSQPLKGLRANPAKSVGVRDVEPNDTKAQAVAFAFSNKRPVKLRGDFASVNDRDYFTFTAARTETIRLKTQGLGRRFTQIEVENAASQKIFETDPGDGVLNGTFVVQAGVTYTVRVRPDDGLPPRYRIKLEPQ